MGKKTTAVFEVVRTETVAPRMVRVIFGGPGVQEFLQHDIDMTDKYVKLVMEPEVPTLRTYTLRWVDHENAELAIDFVTHGDLGLAGPWAAKAQPGDTLGVRGPGGAYRPDPDADWHLFVGDESAIPAIAASVEALSETDRVTAFIEVDGPDHEIALHTAAQLDLHWLHRGTASPGTTQLLFDAVKAWPVPAGRIQAFVHGESGLLKTVRRYLLDGIVERADISVSAYWRLGETEEGFRAWKASEVQREQLRS